MVRCVGQVPAWLVVGFLVGLADLVEQLSVGPWRLAGAVPVRQEREGVGCGKAEAVDESHGGGVGL